MIKSQKRKRNRQKKIISGEINFYAPDNDESTYWVENQKVISQIETYDGFEEALLEKGLTLESNIPNGTVVKFDYQLSSPTNGISKIPLCVACFDGKWYYVREQKLSKHNLTRRYGKQNSENEINTGVQNNNDDANRKKSKSESYSRVQTQ